MFFLETLELPQLGLRGLEGELSEEEQAIQQACNRFATDVMRPIGIQLDTMTPEEVMKEGSPLFEYQQKIQEAGILDLGAIAALSDKEKSRIFPIIFEEMGRGDPGLTITTMVNSLSILSAHATGDAEIIERFGNAPGCWLGTQPDRGSDVVDMDATESYPGTKQAKANLAGAIEGDEVVINGQSSAWVSYGPLAETSLAYIPCDHGDGLYHPDHGGMHHIAILIPLDLPGVSRGRPLDKIGQRPLVQGEVFFDNVRVPRKYVIASGEQAHASLVGALTFGNMEMAATFTGVARAAYEVALDYVHERKQGGTAIINHQSVQTRMFSLWQKVEAARAMTQRAFDFNYSSNGPHVLASITAKTFATTTAFEVASEALQLFGGNGLTRAYPIEKIMRDARASMIEDGENNFLNLKGMRWLSRWYQNKNGISV